MAEPQSPQLYEPDLDELTARAATRMWNIYPGYSAERFPHTELNPSVRANLELAVLVLHRGSGPTYDELHPARDLGTRRANQGVPLESIIQAYRQTERVIVLDLLQQSRNWQQRAAQDAADLVISTFDELTEAMINSYRDTSSAIEAERRRIETELVTALAGGIDVGPSRFERWMRTLEIEPGGRWVAVAVKDSDDGTHAAARQTLWRQLPSLLQTRFRQLLFADTEGVLLVLACHGMTDEEARVALTAALDTAGTAVPLLAGLGESAGTLAAAGTSCRQALDAVRVAAARAGSGPSTLVGYRDVLIDIILGGHPAAADTLLAATLEPLSRHPYLIDTLDSLIANQMSQAATARELYLHPNTVSHRIRRVQELTGEDPTAFRDALDIALALRWRRLRANGAAAPRERSVADSARPVAETSRRRPISVPTPAVEKADTLPPWGEEGDEQ